MIRSLLDTAPPRNSASYLLRLLLKDWETVLLETSPAFWDLIEARRKEATLSEDELERQVK